MKRAVGVGIFWISEKESGEASSTGKGVDRMLEVMNDSFGIEQYISNPEIVRRMTMLVDEVKLAYKTVC